MKPQPHSEAISQPFLKWAGGKRWLVGARADLFPREFQTYYEPFLGGGAAFFSLAPHSAILSDSNTELINTYISIKRGWRRIWALLEDHFEKHDDKHYYRVRASRPVSAEERAARFIYLNQTCWNGLYRVNTKGQFNVPIGSKTRPTVTPEQLREACTRLRKASLRSCDFEDAIALASAGDFVFADPPYVVNHPHNGFLKYNENLFSWHEQQRLYTCLKRASSRGVLVCATNSNHDSIVDLYGRDFELVTVERFSRISGINNGRCKTQELIIRNY